MAFRARVRCAHDNVGGLWSNIAFCARSKNYSNTFKSLLSGRSCQERFQAAFRDRGLDKATYFLALMRQTSMSNVLAYGLIMMKLKWDRTSESSLIKVGIEEIFHSFLNLFWESLHLMVETQWDRLVSQ